MQRSKSHLSKKLRLAAYLCMLMLLGGCGVDSALSSSSSSSGHSAAVPSAVFGDFYDGAVSSHDSEFLYYKPVVSMEEAYPGYKLTQIDLGGKNAFAKYIAANGDIYLGLTDSYLPDCGVFDEIGYYSLSQNKFVSLVKPEQNYDISFSGGALDRYLIWEIVAHGGSARLSINLLDTQTGKSRELFCFSESGLPNLYSSSQMVCIDGIVYFSSDMYDSDGKWISDRLYSYDIDGSGDKLGLAAQEGSYPFSYGGKLAYVVSEQKEDGTSSITVKTADGTVIYRQDSGSEAFVKGGGTLLALTDTFYIKDMIRLKEKKGLDVSEDKASTDDDGYSGGKSCLYTVQNGKVQPLAVSLTGTVQAESCDGRFVCFSGASKTPFFYDAKLGKIVQMQGVKNGSAFSMISGENHLFLKVETYDPATSGFDYSYYLLEKPQ